MTDIPPISVTEARAARSGEPSDWTPRDTLISTLRKIEEGLSIDALVVAYLYTDGERESVGYLQSTPKRPHDAFVTIGLMTKVNEMLCRGEEGK